MTSKLLLASESSDNDDEDMVPYYLQGPRHNHIEISDYLEKKVYPSLDKAFQNVSCRLEI